MFFNSFFAILVKIEEPKPSKQKWNQSKQSKSKTQTTPPFELSVLPQGARLQHYFHAGFPSWAFMILWQNIMLEGERKLMMMDVVLFLSCWCLASLDLMWKSCLTRCLISGIRMLIKKDNRISSHFLCWFLSLSNLVFSVFPWVELWWFDSLICKK